MEYLLNPNVAYLLLSTGMMLAVFAVLTPGTGLIEVGALFCLVLSAYSVFNLPINFWALLVLLLGVFPFLLALRKSRQMGFLAAAIAAFVLGSAYLFRGPAWYLPAVNPFLALVVSLVYGGFFWFAVRKVLETLETPPAHSLETLIGAVGEARSRILEEGSVYVNGELWSATSRQEIPAGAQVRVTGRQGLILAVEAIDEKGL